MTQYNPPLKKNNLMNPYIGNAWNTQLLPFEYIFHIHPREDVNSVISSLFSIFRPRFLSQQWTL